MSIVQHHIKNEKRRYDQAEVQFLNLLDKERENLERYAASEKAKQGYIDKMNYLLRICHTYQQNTVELLQAFAEGTRIMDESESSYYRNKYLECERENEKMRAWLRSLGKDPNLVGWMQQKDFMY